MANSIIITFTQPAEVNDHIEFKLNVSLGGTINQFVRGNSFKNTRSYPGEVVIGANANAQALNYYNAFIIDYGSSFTVTILANVVTITSIGDEFISDYSITGSSYSTAEIVADPGTDPVPVTWFTSPYPYDGKAFTLDPKFFEITTEATGTYFQFNSTIKTYDFITNAVNIQTIPQKLVPFKGFTNINLGKLIHRLMSKFNEVNESFNQYQYAELSIVCIELLLSNNSIVRSHVSPTIPFIAGLSRGITDFGFLEFNPKPNRVTKNSFAYLNFYIPPGTFEMRTFKNNTLINTEALPIDATTTLCKKVQFNDFIQGDVIEYVIDVIGEENNDAPKKTFILFPSGNFSNMIVWENEFKVQSSIECTGTGVLDPDLEYQSQKIYRNLVEVLEHLSTSKEVKAFIDTGWLLFTDIDTIESLMRSKRVWLVQAEKRISLRPIGKKLPKQDYDNELISYQLEFTINRAYDEETYTL
ncbi:hypothetical protein [Flavobacterium taihuense]|uniref:Uncharacterized protein n=1 Tax=Flavobacterium taihuense TaxID=2857508 RepID=A0ABS6Y0P5_9FLAO|nr:hypothetical protein [Flavobacterium taihuense]MBW4362501.1 hypothetical protein [Flavobacterium taihuense]